MSTYWTVVFPADPFWVPSQDRADAAIAVFSLLINGEPDVEVEVRTSHQLVFESAGADFNSATCPHCQAIVAQSPDEMAWFGVQLDDLLSQATESRALLVTMPCCGQTQSMNDLIYAAAAAGFATWSVSAREPRYTITDRERALIAGALGRDVRVVEMRV